MANQKSTSAEGTRQQGDNRRSGDVDGNRGAKPKTGTQGVNESAGNQADGTNTSPDTVNPDSGNNSKHSEAEALYRDR